MPCRGRSWQVVAKACVSGCSDDFLVSHVELSVQSPLARKIDPYVFSTIYWLRKGCSADAEVGKSH